MVAEVVSGGRAEGLALEAAGNESLAEELDGVLDVTGMAAVVVIPSRIKAGERAP